MSDRRVSGLSALLDKRLPLNRKEQYYTGTVLPMIVASDGFRRLRKFLDLCGVAGVAIEASPKFTNVLFFSEYGFKRSLMGARDRFDPRGYETPDLVVYVESEPALLLGIEAKMFDLPSVGDLRRQLQAQLDLLRVMRDGLETNPSVHQVALLPAELCKPWPDPEHVDGVPVLTWEKSRMPSVTPPLTGSASNGRHSVGTTLLQAAGPTTTTSSRGGRSTSMRPMPPSVGWEERAV